MRGYDWFLAGLACLALMVAVAPDVLILIGSLGVTIPLAFVLAFLPAVAVVLIPARVVQVGVLNRVLSQLWLAGALSVTIVLAVLAAVPRGFNAHVAARIDAAVAGDRNDLAQPLPRGTYGIQTLTGRRHERQVCDDLCLRLLLTGQADRVILALLPGPEAADDMDTRHPAWTIERRDTCPEADMATSDDQGRRSLGPAGGPSPYAVMLARIAGGECLIRSMAPLGQADVILSNLRLEQGGRDLGIGAPRGELTLDRLSVRLRGPEGWVEPHRLTVAHAVVMAPLALPVLHDAGNWNLSLGWWSVQVQRNIRTNQFYEGPDWRRFLTGTLAMDLVPQAATDAAPAVAQVLRDRLGDPAPFDANAQGLVEAWLNPARRLSGADHAALYLAALTDPRVVLPYSAVSQRPRDQDAAYDLAIGRAAFDRIWRRGADAGNADALLVALPDAVILGLREDLFRLSQSPVPRVQASQVLRRMVLFGDDGHRALLAVIDGVARIDRRSAGFLKPYLPSLAGLCDAGSEAAALAPDLVARVEAGVIPLDHRRHGALGIQTLVRLGVPQDRVMALVAQHAPVQKPETVLRLIEAAERGLGCRV
jgi:hypothetical protein